MFQAKDAFVINNIKKIDTLNWTKISACFTPKMDSISFISFHSNISAFMDDIAIYPAQNFNVNLNSKPCDKKINYAVINPLPNYKYTYIFGDSNNIVTHSSVMSHSYSKEGLYYSHLIGKDTITNQFFCSSSIINIDYIEANFFHPNSISSEVSTQILNASTNASSFIWTLNNQTISSNASPEIKFPSGLNLLCLKAKNKTGCVDSICKDIYVNECDRISEFNIFTPNDDNVNDLLYFFEGNSCDSSKISITIFNRWGQVYYRYPILGLFELNEPISDHFKPTKAYTYKYWNGYFNNLGPKQADPGVYFIIIETPSIRKSRSVTLIR
ncbi:MAG: gliding motility-associated C-terminal domain-containing protein [Bacteroidia bacterium]|nr:gliding motility-associated C-terminal domain-containing protein [Bacteroidia bacterium]